MTTDVDHTFVYEYGAASSLGVGFSFNDVQGSWSEAGTASQSSTAQVTYPTYGNGQGVYYETEFVYGLFQDEDACSGWDAQPTGYAGGAITSVSDQAPGTVKAHCVVQQPNSTFTKTTTLAVEWTDGLNIAAALGIDLSTQTGYSSTASVVFRFHALRDLCGTDGLPGGSSPSQLVARNYIAGT